MGYIEDQLNDHLNQLDKDDAISNFIEEQLSDEWHPAIAEEYTKFILDNPSNTSLYDWMDKFNSSEIAALVSEWHQKELAKQLHERTHSLNYLFPDVANGKANSKRTKAITKKVIRRLKEIAVDNNFNPSLDPEYRKYLIESATIEGDEVSFSGTETYLNWMSDIYEQKPQG